MFLLSLRAFTFIFDSVSVFVNVIDIFAFCLLDSGHSLFHFLSHITVSRKIAFFRPQSHCNKAYHCAQYDDKHTETGIQDGINCVGVNNYA